MRENMFGILAMISVLLGGYMFIRCLFKKKFKKGFKWAVGGLLSMFICVTVGFGGETSKEKPVKQDVVKEETDATKKAAEEEEEKKKAEEQTKKEKVKQAYLKELKPEIDQLTKVYDDNWNKIWKPTMDAISKGSTDYYAAYNNMKTIKNNYEGGRFISLDPVKGMSEADRKLLKTYSQKMGDAFTFRVMAVEIAMNGFNTGVLQPSEVNKMQTYIQMADSSLIEAVSAITTIEVSLVINTQ